MCVCSVPLQQPPNGFRRLPASCDRGDMPHRSTLGGRAAACERRRIGDCKIGAGQGQARVVQQNEYSVVQQNGWTRAGPPQDRCYTVAQYLGEAESLCMRARGTGKRSPMGGQGIRVPEVGKATVAAVMDDVTRPSPQPR